MVQQKHGDLMVSAFSPGLSCLGWSPDWGGHWVVFLGKTPNSYSASLNPGVEYKWVPVNLMLGGTQCSPYQAVTGKIYRL